MDAKEIVAELRRVAQNASHVTVGPSPVCDERIGITGLLLRAANMIEASQMEISLTGNSRTSWGVDTIEIPTVLDR